MIEYRYTILAQNASGMEVQFEAEGYSTVSVGTPLVPEGQDINAFMDAYVPIGHWGLTPPVVDTPPSALLPSADTSEVQAILDLIASA